MSGTVENVNVEPPLTVIISDRAAVDDTSKSSTKPVVAPVAPETTMVQKITLPTR